MSQKPKRKRWHDNRPRLAPESVRDTVLRIRVNAEELTSIQIKAATMGVPIGTWAREALLARQLRVSPVPEINRDAYRELRQIGNNLNQLAREAHQGRLHIPLEQFQTLEALLRKIKMLLLDNTHDRETA